jgi:hypothetical protein
MDELTSLWTDPNRAPVFWFSVAMGLGILLGIWALWRGVTRDERKCDEIMRRRPS